MERFLDLLSIILVWLIVLALPMSINYIIPFKLCNEFDIVNCKEYLVNLSIIVAILIYIKAAIIVLIYRNKYFYFYNIYDFFKHNFLFRNSSLRKMKRECAPDELIAKRDECYTEILITLIYLMMFLNFFFFLHAIIGFIDKHGMDYREIITKTLGFNFKLTILLIILLSIFFTYKLFKIKRRHIITYGILELVVGVTLCAFTIGNYLSSVLNKSAILKSYELVFLLFLFLGSLRISLSGLENIKNGIEKVELNNSEWKEKYLN